MSSPNPGPQEPHLCLLCGTDLARLGRHALTKYCAECWTNRRKARKKANKAAYLYRRKTGNACPHLKAGLVVEAPRRQELGGKILLEFPYEDEAGHRYRRCLKCFEQELGYLAI